MAYATYSLTDGEADNVAWYCSDKCRAFELPALQMNNDVSLGINNDFPDGTICNTCKAPLVASTVPPDGHEDGANDLRAEQAEDTLTHYAITHGEHYSREDPLGHGMAAQNIGDFICNLCHYCDRNDISFAECLRIAADHYDAETDNQGKQFDAEAPIVTISGGVGEVVQGSARIIDFDNLKETLAEELANHAETGKARKNIQLDAVELAWLEEHDPDFLERMRPYLAIM